MSVGAVVICRLDSTRLPGKVLRLISDRPLLDYVLTRCQRVALLKDSIVVATTDRSIDDPIAAYCEHRGVHVYRGAAEDVAGRVLACAQACGFDFFLRVNADSPFLDPELVNSALALAQNYDIVTNLYPRSFPYGVSVELLRTQAFASAYSRMYLAEHFEHVTYFLYQNMSSFRYFNIFREGHDLSHVRLTIDTEEDLELFRRMIAASGERWSALTYLDAVDLQRKVSAT